MIVKGIPFRIWQQVIQIAAGFFFVVAVISPFLAHFLYLFDKDIDYFFTKSAQKPAQEVEIVEHPQIYTDSSMLSESQEPFIPKPDIKSHLKFSHYNARPDTDGADETTISLTLNGNKLNIKPHQSIYLECKDDSSLVFSEKETPYKITPESVSESGLLLSLDVNYSDKNGKSLYSDSQKIRLTKDFEGTNKLSQISQGAYDSLIGASFLKPDELIKLDSSKKYANQKNLYRLCLKDHKPLFVSVNDKLSFSKNQWTIATKSTSKKPLCVIESIDNEKMVLSYYSKGGFFHKKIIANLQKDQSESYKNFAFDQIYQRNKDSVVAKIEGKTFIIKSGDWLINSDTLWKHLTNVDEFDNLLNQTAHHEVLICESIEEKNDQYIFFGYLFDKTRSQMKKLEIPLKNKSMVAYNK